MTIVQKSDSIESALYKVLENGKIKYCTLEEVLYLLSTKEDKIEVMTEND